MVQGSDYAANIDQIPVDAVDRIEVVKGPNSALYGEKAMAGVINIITKTPTMGQKTTVKGELGNWGYRRGVITTQGGDEKMAISSLIVKNVVITMTIKIIGGINMSSLILR